MTKVQAVTRLLRTINEGKIATLDTGGLSPAALAEDYIDEADAEIQTEGWHVNTESEIVLSTADITKQVMVIATGTWDVSAMTLTKTAAFTTYTWAKGDQLYVSGGTGVTAGWFRIASKTSANAIVMQDSIATADAANITTTLIGWGDAIAVGDDILKIDTTDTNDAVVRSGMLFDRENDTFSWGDTLTVEQIRQLDFATLSLTLQTCILTAAAIKFHQRMFEGERDNTHLVREYQDARRRLMREEAEIADVNVLEDDHAADILGNARTWTFR